MKINIFWFRRDLRLDDNTGLTAALNSGVAVIPVFIFDTNIIDELPEDDPRVSFIYKNLSCINDHLVKRGCSLKIFKGDPATIWKQLVSAYEIDSVYINKDYEPYSIRRDNAVEKILETKNIRLLRFKDQVIFEENEVLKPDQKPYTVFTPFRNKWLQKYKGVFHSGSIISEPNMTGFARLTGPFPKLKELGFRESNISVKPYDLGAIAGYDKTRDFPAVDRTTYLSPHLRFGTISIRRLVARAVIENSIFLDELIWREFFMQVLFHFPHVVTDNFKSSYNGINWRNNEAEFRKWCNGETGYPIVDAGMRQLNESGYMHNRVRMITAGFLCKHLLTDWRWGEAYFAEKLLDYELSSNNGNWQWAAGTGCDAVPYFRVFNPDTQQKKFDPDNVYINRWTGGAGQRSLPGRIVEHEFARQRALETYKAAIEKIRYK